MGSPIFDYRDKGGENAGRFRNSREGVGVSFVLRHRHKWLKERRFPPVWIDRGKDSVSIRMGSFR